MKQALIITFTFVAMLMLPGCGNGRGYGSPNATPSFDSVGTPYSLYTSVLAESCSDGDSGKRYIYISGETAYAYSYCQKAWRQISMTELAFSEDGEQVLYQDVLYQRSE